MAVGRSTSRCGSSAQTNQPTNRTEQPRDPDEVHLQRRDGPCRGTDRHRQDRRGSRLRLDRAARLGVLHGEAVGGLPVHDRRVADVEREHAVGRPPHRVGLVANLTNNRFGFGVGIGWAPEEFEWCGVPYKRRGARVDEMIEVIKLVLAGGMVEFHGDFYDFDRLQMSPAPSQPVPFYVGGHTDVALKRAARVSDGWTSAMMTCDQLAETIGKIKALLAEYDRADVPFEYQAVCIDKFGVDGHRELAEAGVTNNIVIPWIYPDFGGLRFC